MKQLRERKAQRKTGRRNGSFETEYEPVNEDQNDWGERVNRWLTTNVQTDSETPLVAPELFEVTGNALDGQPVTTSLHQCEETPLLPPEMDL